MAKTDARLFFSLLALSLSLIFLFPVASALDVPPSQEDIILTMERGASLPIFLLVNDVDEEVTLKADGEIENWVRFGEDKEAELNITPAYYTTVVLVTVSVPKDAELEEYEGSINADSRKLSSLRIKVTLELSDAKAYEQLSDVDEEVNRLREKVESMADSLNSMRVQIATLEEEVSSKMEEIYKYQKDLTALENEKNDLEEENTALAQNLQDLQTKSDELEESNKELNELTGMLVGTQLPGMFFGGIILGIIVVTLALKRSHVAKKIKSRVQRLKQRGKGESFRYNYPG
jgi:myosin heavy subunit